MYVQCRPSTIQKGELTIQFQMSEEVRGASVNVARSMVLSVLLNGVLAFGMLLAVLFCAGDISSLLGASGYPFITIFANGAHSKKGATAMASLPLVLSGLAAIGNMAAASRMMWAFARDEGLPGWRSLSRVSILLYCSLCREAVIALKLSVTGRSPYDSSYQSHHYSFYHVRTSLSHQRWILYCLERRYLSGATRILHILFPCNQPTSLPTFKS